MTTAQKPDLLYGVPAISEWLGLSEKQARHRIDKGAIPTFRIGGTICARRSTLAEWLAECEAAASPAIAALSKVRTA